MGYATCDTFKCPATHVNTDGFCKGVDKAGNDISKNRGKAAVCSGAKDTCNIQTCCTAGGPTEDSCFPGEAEVSLQGRSAARINEIETGMTVFAADGFEQVFGMLHLQSEVSPTLAHASTVSV